MIVFVFAVWQAPTTLEYKQIMDFAYNLFTNINSLYIYVRFVTFHNTMDLAYEQHMLKSIANL